jgi:hypothetical protein
VYSISGVPLNRVNDDQVIKRSGIFTILKWWLERILLFFAYYY